MYTFVLRATFDDGEGYPRSFFFYLNLQVKEGNRQVLSHINILAVLYVHVLCGNMPVGPNRVKTIFKLRGNFMAWYLIMKNKFTLNYVFRAKVLPVICIIRNGPMAIKKRKNSY